MMADKKVFPQVKSINKAKGYQGKIKNVLSAINVSFL